MNFHKGGQNATVCATATATAEEGEKLGEKGVVFADLILTTRTRGEESLTVASFAMEPLFIQVAGEPGERYGASAHFATPHYGY